MEELNVSPLYKRGFNDAYMLSELKPEILKGMQIPEKEPSEYTRGFKDGQKQHEKEMVLGRSKPDREKERGIDRGR